MSTYRTVLRGPSAVARPQRFARSRNFASSRFSSLRLEALEQRHLLTATVVEVTTTQDVIDPNDGLVSLREAVLEANASPNDYQIVLPAGTYTLTIQGANEDAALTGDLDILNSGSVTIVGAGADTTTIDASGLFDAGLGYGDRIFDVQTSAALDLTGLTLTGGSAPTASTSSGASGGAIRNAGGQLTVIDCTLSNNDAPLGLGGVIYNLGQLTVTGSTFSGNTAHSAGSAVYTNSSQSSSIGSSEFLGNSTTVGSGAPIYQDGGQLSITGCSVSGTDGDGIANYYGQLTIVDSDVTGNSGSGLHNGGGGVLTVVDSLISENAASGIFNDMSSQLEVVGCTISNNTGGAYGGGIYTTGPTTITASTITGNTARAGGGIAANNEFLPGNVVSIVNSVISDNVATGHGAGGILSEGEMTISGSTISGNHAAGEGGGIVKFVIGNPTTLTISNSTVQGNSATTGGGIKNDGSPLTITESTISDNTATLDGGGILNSGVWLLETKIINSTVSNNSANRDGGGVYSGRRLTVSNSTITGNRADADGIDGGLGGGFALTPNAVALLQNTIVAGNLRGADPGAADSDIELSGGQVDPASSYNLIGDPNTAGGLVNGTNGNIVGDATGNALDINAILDPNLADNGGPTLTHKLVDGSPAINAGDPAFDPNATDPPTFFDQRGVGFPRVKNGRLDIGAYEADANLIGPGNVITVGTFDDSLAVDGVWSLREAVMYANSHPGDFTIQLPAGTYTLTRQGANEDAALTGDLDILNNGSVQIVGAGADTTTIDASGLFDAGLGYGDRLFDVHGATLSLDGLTLTGGSTPTSGDDADTSGGAIRNSGGELFVTGSTLSNNTAKGSGGGIYSSEAVVTIDGTTISSNAAGSGGGIYCNQSQLTVRNSTLSGNSGEGGAISSHLGETSIIDSTLSDNNAPYDGGGILNFSSDLRVVHTMFAGNTSQFVGGAIYSRSVLRQDVSVVDSTFVDNSAAGSGGGIWIDNGSILFTNTTFSGNSAVLGGAVYNNEGQITLTNSTVSGNSAGGGGGIYNFSRGNMTITGSTISDNMANGSGGGIYSGGQLLLQNSTVSGNTASDGGGISGFASVIACTISGNSAVASATSGDSLYAGDGGGISGSVTLIDSTVSGNSATNDGGGIFEGGTIRNSTIVGNRADSDDDGAGIGGGICAGYGSLQNTIVAGNVRGAAAAEEASDVELESATHFTGGSYNLIGDPHTAGGLVDGTNGNIVGDASGRALDINAILDPNLADNGGPTLTHKLLDGSPAINAGDPAFDPNATDPPTLFDQRGVGFPRVKNGRLDIGAYEADANLIGPGNVITVGTFDDSLAVDGVWSLREAVMYANSHPGDFTIQLPAGTYTLTRQGANEDAALTGDLDILNNGSVTIVGAGADTTTIDASGLFDAGLGYGDRLFDVHGATLSLDGLTLTGGSTPTSGDDADTSGGAIRNTGGELFVTNDTLSNNTAKHNGGGIYGIQAVINVTGTTLTTLSADLGALYADDHSTVTVTDSTISDVTGFGIICKQCQLTVRNSTLSGNLGGAIRLFSSETSIIDSTISENRGNLGAINNQDGDLSIVHSIFAGNTSFADVGGAITNYNSQNVNSKKLSVVDSTFLNNNAYSNGGGAIGSYDGTVLIANSTFSGNSAYNGGGAIFVSGGSFTLTSSVVSGNSAQLEGGGIESWGCRMTITGSTISDNTAARGGGIVETRGRGQLLLQNSTVSGNTALNDSGGGIWSSGSSAIINSTLSNNSTKLGGGGVYSTGPLTISNSTITGNRADANGIDGGLGGGFALINNAVALLQNSIIAGNVRGAGPGAADSDIELSGGQVDPASSYNLIGDPHTAGGLVDGVNGNIVGDGNGNSLDIHTVLDTTLADNGGPTLTHALVPGSPAVNAGDPAFDPNATDPPTLFDQRGAGYSRVVGRHVDIGAYESGATFQTVVTGRQIFYDNSTFNGNVSGVGPFDAFAIATDKQALLPGGSLAGPQNVTSYSRGINGIMVDIAGSHPDITAADFIFRVGSNNAPDTWAAAPAPSAVVVLPGQGDGGSDRVEIVWPDGAIKNTYLEVIVAADAHTGLSSPDEFFFGNRVGDTLAGTPASYFVTNAADEIAARQSTGVAYQISNALDFDRNGVVNAADQIIARTNGGVLSRIQISPPPAPLAQPSGTSDALASKPSDDLRNAVTASLTVPTESVPATAESPAPAVVLAKAAPLSAAQVDWALAADWSYAADSLDELFSTGNANEVDELALELLIGALT